MGGGQGNASAKFANGADALVALVEEVFEFAAAEVAEAFEEVLFEVVGGLMPVAVSAAEGLFDDVVDEVKFEQVGGGEFEVFGGAGSLGAVFIKDGGATFGGDD
jgi:hypothetical protein